MKSVAYVLAALGGAVTGAALGLLFAPQKGERTRREIRKYINEHCPEMRKGKEKLDEIANKIASEIRDLKA